MTHRNEDDFIALARSRLDETADKTSLKVSMRLQKARMEALEAAASRQSENVLVTDGAGFQFPTWLNTASTGTFLGGLILVSGLLWLQPLPEATSHSTFEDIQLLSTPQDLEMIRDLDFFIWLSDENLKD